MTPEQQSFLNRVMPVNKEVFPLGSSMRGAQIEHNNVIDEIRQRIIAEFENGTIKIVDNGQ